MNMLTPAPRLTARHPLKGAMRVARQSRFHRILEVGPRAAFQGATPAAWRSQFRGVLGSRHFAPVWLWSPVSVRLM